MFIFICEKRHFSAHESKQAAHYIHIHFVVGVVDERLMGFWKKTNEFLLLSNWTMELHTTESRLGLHNEHLQTKFITLENYLDKAHGPISASAETKSLVTRTSRKQYTKFFFKCISR